MDQGTGVEWPIHLDAFVLSSSHSPCQDMKDTQAPPLEEGSTSPLGATILHSMRQ